MPHVNDRFPAAGEGELVGGELYPFGAVRELDYVAASVEVELALGAQIDDPHGLAVDFDRHVGVVGLDDELAAVGDDADELRAGEVADGCQGEGGGDGGDPTRAGVAPQRCGKKVG